LFNKKGPPSRTLPNFWESRSQQPNLSSQGLGLAKPSMKPKGTNPSVLKEKRAYLTLKNSLAVIIHRGHKQRVPSLSKINQKEREKIEMRS